MRSINCDEKVEVCFEVMHFFFFAGDVVWCSLCRRRVFFLSITYRRWGPINLFFSFTVCCRKMNWNVSYIFWEVVRDEVLRYLFRCARGTTSVMHEIIKWAEIQSFHPKEWKLNFLFVSNAHVTCDEKVDLIPEIKKYFGARASNGCHIKIWI